MIRTWAYNFHSNIERCRDFQALKNWYEHPYETVSAGWEYTDYGRRYEQRFKLQKREKPVPKSQQNQ